MLSGHCVSVYLPPKSFTSGNLTFISIFDALFLCLATCPNDLFITFTFFSLVFYHDYAQFNSIRNH